MARLLVRLIDAQQGWARPLGEFNRRWISAIYRRTGPLKDLAHGRWLGHPVHAAVTDIPIGALTVTIVLDLLNQRAAADAALVVGIVFMVVAALTGAADYSDTDGTALTRATVHSVLMVVSLVLYVVSLVLRTGAPADRTVPIVLSVIGYLVLTAGAYVGGDVVYQLGNMVNRHAFRGAGGKWLALDVATLADLPEGAPFRAKAGINNLVLVRTGSTVAALHDQCAHAGGPLSEGAIVDGCVECPWHGSRFRLTDGRAMRGPTVYDQPRYEVRVGEHGLEARRVAD
ncbi:MAG TPA: Rieske (2Fe-2S) protein [Candidatus Limnocylindrales bacterium]